MDDKIRIKRELQGGVRIRSAHNSHVVESSALSKGDVVLALSFPIVSAKQEAGRRKQEAGSKKQDSVTQLSIPKDKENLVAQEKHIY